MRATMVNRTDGGTYEIPGAAETEDWGDVQTDAGVAGVEHVGPLTGWAPWTDVYRVSVQGDTEEEDREVWYFVEG